MLNQDTLAKLRDFHLSGFIQGLVEQSTSTKYHDLSFEERLTMLVESEYSIRQQKKIKKRLRTASLLMHPSLDRVDFQTTKGLSKSSFLEHAQGNWITRGHHLIITGPTGVGKTFLASAIADTLCRKAVAVKYFRAIECVGELLLAREENAHKKLKLKLSKFPLLIIDEWLRDPLNYEQAREFSDLLEERFRKSSCLFLSQYPISAWHQRISDPTLADAILDRIIHDSIKIELSGESMRKITSTLITKETKEEKEGSVASLR